MLCWPAGRLAWCEEESSDVIVADVGERGEESKGVESGSSGLEVGMEAGSEVSMGCMAGERRERKREIGGDEEKGLLRLN